MYEVEGDKKITSDGGVRVINTLVQPKEQIQKHVASGTAPAAFGALYQNVQHAPQGTTDDMVAQFGASIVIFRVNPGKKPCPKVGDTFSVTNLVFPSKLPGEGDKMYAAGGALGMLPFHTISVDDLKITNAISHDQLLALKSALPLHAANLLVLASSPAVQLQTSTEAMAQYSSVLANLTHSHSTTLAGALKPSLCDPCTAGNPQSRAVFMNPDENEWMRNIGTAANDPNSCNLAKVMNMLCLTTSPSLVIIDGTTYLFDPPKVLAVQMMKNKFVIDETKANTPVVGVYIVKLGERDFADAKLQKANARDAPKVMEIVLEVAITTPTIVQDAMSGPKELLMPSIIAKMSVTISLMSNHITGPFGVDNPKLSSAFLHVIKPVLVISFVGSLAQNASGDTLSDKGKQTVANQRVFQKELGVTELDLIRSPQNVIVDTEGTLKFAIKLSAEYVKNGLGMFGGGDFVSEMRGTITDAVETSCAAAEATYNADQVKYKKDAAYSKPQCFANGNLKLAKDAEYSCINQDGAADVRGTVYAFVPGLADELKNVNATTELLDSTAFGEKILTNALNLNGVAGELIAKVHHNAVFLIQKRFAATVSGTSIAVKTGGELDFSYMAMDAAAQDGATTATAEPPAKKTKK